MLLLIYEYLTSMGLSQPLSQFATIIASLSGLALGSWILMRMIRLYLNQSILKLLKKSNKVWADNVRKHKLLHKTSYLIPGLIFYATQLWFADLGRMGVSFAKGLGILSSLYFVVILTLIFNSILTVITESYESYEISKRNPIRSYIQVLKIIIFLAASIVSLSIILDKSPLVFLTGLGAATAVTMLVFKDSIQGFVSSIQIAFYDIVRIGDWITVPSFNADGDVEEISLTTVKIRNFDKTVSTVPTYALLTTGVKNWRGMQEAGGRRIKRSLNIDMNTVKFCSEDMLRRFEKIDLLKDELKDRQEEISAYNRELVSNRDIPINGRMMTNLGVFRLYVNEYLKNNSHIHKNGFTFLVRQLQPTETGIPLELYIFTNDTNWVNYESIQSDIFDHLLAAFPIFELKVFQNISGNELPHLAAVGQKTLPRATIEKKAS